MRIAVTGSAGFVGTYVMRELLSHSHEAVGVDIRPPAQAPADTAEFRQADLTDPASLLRAFEGCEAIVHLAAVPDPGIVSPEELFRVNVLGTFNALEAAVAVGARRFVAASSEGALGFSFRKVDMKPLYLPIDEEHPLRPQDEYSLGKVLIEEMCRSYTARGSLSTVSLRTCYVWDKSLGGFDRIADPAGAYGSCGSTSTRPTPRAPTGWPARSRISGTRRCSSPLRTVLPKHRSASCLSASCPTCPSGRSWAPTAH
jgi:UDP-glucose 4-epimerase